MKIVHFGDIHVWRKVVVVRELCYLKRWLGPINLFLRRAKRFPAAYRKPVIDAIIKEDADFVFFSGDFTTLASEAEFQAAADLFQPLLDHYGDRFFAIPGNHDRYTPGSERKNLIERYLPYAAVNRVKRKDLSSRLTAVAVDHAEPFKIRSNGIVRKETHEALEQVLTSLQEENRIPVLMGHFPCLSPPEHPEHWDHGLLGEGRLRDLINRYKVPVYLHGHQHVRWIITSDATPHTRHLNCGAAGMKSSQIKKQAGYLRFTLTETGQCDAPEAVIWNDRGQIMEPTPVSEQFVPAPVP